jgi:hypothetical protein
MVGQQNPLVDLFGPVLPSGDSHLLYLLFGILRLSGCMSQEAAFLHNMRDHLFCARIE